MITQSDVCADIPSILIRLRALRRLDNHRVLPKLILILGQLPGVQLDVQERYHALRKLELTVVRVAAALALALAPARLGVSSGASGGSAGHSRGPSAPPSLEQRLYSAMALNCVHLLHDLDHGQGFFSDQHAADRTWAIRTAFRFFSRELLYAVKTWRDWPAGAWLALHELFVYLVMRGNVRLHDRGIEPLFQARRHARTPTVTGATTTRPGTSPQPRRGQGQCRGDPHNGQLELAQGVITLLHIQLHTRQLPEDQDEFRQHPMVIESAQSPETDQDGGNIRTHIALGDHWPAPSCHLMCGGDLILCALLALIIIPPTLFSHGVAAPLQNMVLRAQTHMGRPALGGFVTKAHRANSAASRARDRNRHVRCAQHPGLGGKARAHSTSGSLPSTAAPVRLPAACSGPAEAQ